MARKKSRVGKPTYGLGGQRQTYNPWQPSTNIAWQTPQNNIKGQPHPAGPGGYATPGAPPPPSAPPPDPEFEAFKLQSGRNLQVADARANYDIGQIRQEFGFDDLSNPYSRAALAQENYQRSVRGTQNQYAAQGQLYSGARERMQGENQRNYSIQNDQLRREYDRLLAGVGFDKAQSYANYGSGVGDAAFDALLKALRGG